MTTNEPKPTYPPVTVEHDPDVVPSYHFCVVQGGNVIALCSNVVTAHIVAERLNEWFARR